MKFGNETIHVSIVGSMKRSIPVIYYDRINVDHSIIIVSDWKNENKLIIYQSNLLNKKILIWLTQVHHTTNECIIYRNYRKTRDRFPFTRDQIIEDIFQMKFRSTRYSKDFLLTFLNQSWPLPKTCMAFLFRIFIPPETYAG